MCPWEGEGGIQKKKLQTQCINSSSFCGCEMVVNPKTFQAHFLPHIHDRGEDTSPLSPRSAAVKARAPSRAAAVRLQVTC